MNSGGGTTSNGRSKMASAASPFGAAITPYLDDPAMLRTLLSKIMQSPAKNVAIVAAEREFDSLEDVQKKVGESVNVVRL